ncbi:hypothetical protein FISHEDRAFT_65761 [Fistulina hepatica ATCC 64428]|uniref:DDE Tnp4 domain-containing protein n=1 Tax=Fistulina hepatica ATCC 64428 TaxID=1128425 RepID=A0A0D7ACL1_9AGAR|nr:hypothetical protein FISHEDRAFT_65761 [Fistulina hepatica ATCC 64428]
MLAATSFAVTAAEISREARSDRRSLHRAYLTRPELMSDPRVASPWQSLYASRSDRAFIATMGLDVSTFDLILDNGFAERWNTRRIPRLDSDHPRGTAAPRLSLRSLDTAGGLGLVLHYYNSTMVETNLCQIFALVPSTITCYIDFAIVILLETLRGLPEATIHWLKGEEFQECNDIVIVRHPHLTGAFGTMDGLNLPVQTSVDEDIENATYNGWLHEHFVSLVIAFAATGEIIACQLNAPGSWHDARIARPIYDKLETATPDGYYLVTDTAFPRGTDRIKGKIRALQKSNERWPRDPAAKQAAKALDNELVSFRQSAEWGMRAIQGSFGRLRIPLPIRNNHRRSNLLESCLRLHQLRTRRVGINQIHSVYVQVWTEDEEQRRIFADFENMFFRDQKRADRISKFYFEERDDK